MTEESQKFTGTTKANAEDELREFTRKLDDIKKKVKKKEELMERFYKRSELTRKYDFRAEEAKKVAMDRNTMLMQGNKRLKGASRAANEIHSTGLDIYNELNKQGAQLKSTDIRLKDMSGHTKVSAAYVKGMERREFIYKGLLVLISVLLMLVIFTLLYIKINRK